MAHGVDKMIVIAHERKTDINNAQTVAVTAIPANRAVWVEVIGCGLLCGTLCACW